MEQNNELDNIKEINQILYNIFNLLFTKLNTILENDKYYNYDYLIKYILIFCINTIFFLNKLLIQINKILQHNIEKNKKLLIKIHNIENSLNTKNIEIMNLYDNIFKNNDKNITIKVLKKINYDGDHKNDDNLDLYSLDNDNCINKLINNNTNLEKCNLLSSYKNDSNYLGYKKINIGFNNFYYLHTFEYIESNLPFNLLLYIKEIDQVLIKIGKNNKFQYINSKLYKTYNFSDYSNENKFHSILCNNNIQKLNKKCFNKQCKYYHDYILGYKDNYHKTRSFTLNPIVYNCISFKDGTKVKENIKKISWYDAINLYQSSLSNILISCIHSQE